MDDHNICWEYSVYGSIAQNLKFSAWVMCGTVVILQIIYNEGEYTGSVYCFQFYNKGILLKFQSSFSSSVVEIFRPLTPPNILFHHKYLSFYSSVLHPLCGLLWLLSPSQEAGECLSTSSMGHPARVLPRSCNRLTLNCWHFCATEIDTE